MYEPAGGWGDEPGFGAPLFVLTHRPEETVVKGDTSFEFVTDGAEAALDRARAAAAGSNVLVMGRADLPRQCLDLGAIDEFALTIAPVLLGAGRRLFQGVRRLDLEFERIGVIESPFATHLRHRMLRPTTRDAAAG